MAILLDSIDIISAIIDNNDKFQIALCIQVDTGDIHHVTIENHNDIIKGIIYLNSKKAKFDI